MSNNFLLLLVSGALLYLAYNPPPRNEPKQTNLIFYVHDDFNGENPPSVAVAGRGGPGSHILQFGTIAAADGPVTEGPSIESKEVGRAQGGMINCQRDGRALHVLFSVIFTDGEFKGSSLEFQGPDILSLKNREFGVVSGTGNFRFVKGYAIVQTVFADLAPNLKAIIQFNVTVKHY